jgi:hypothetical protein
MPRPSRKTVLFAAVVGALTIAALVTLRGQTQRADDVSGAAKHTVPARDAGAANLRAPNAEPSLTEDIAEAIVDRFEALSDRIEVRLEASAAERASMNQALADLTGGTRSLQASIAELENGRGSIERRIADTHVRLDGVARDVEGIKAPNQARAATQRPRTAGEPPFHVDAIDIWDDVLYVAVSQGGQAAFLRVGERQSGWEVTHIDRSKGEIVFRRPDGQTYTASVGR